MKRSRTQIIDAWQRNAVDVFCLNSLSESGVDGTMTRYRDDGQFEEVAIGEAPQEAFTGRPAPTFRIPLPVLDELVARHRKEYPTRANDDQVKDLRETRDRLLSLVEFTIVERSLTEDAKGAVENVKALR